MGSQLHTATVSRHSAPLPARGERFPLKYSRIEPMNLRASFPLLKKACILHYFMGKLESEGKLFSDISAINGLPADLDTRATPTRTENYSALSITAAANQNQGSPTQSKSVKVSQSIIVPGFSCIGVWPDQCRMGGLAREEIRFPLSAFCFLLFLVGTVGVDFSPSAR
jgi:hypothetical protein